MVLSVIVKFVLYLYCKKNENKQKEAGFGPFLILSTYTVPTYNNVAEFVGHKGKLPSCLEPLVQTLTTATR